MLSIGIDMWESCQSENVARFIAFEKGKENQHETPRAMPRIVFEWMPKTLDDVLDMFDEVQP